MNVNRTWFVLMIHIVVGNVPNILVLQMENNFLLGLIKINLFVQLVTHLNNGMVNLENIHVVKRSKAWKLITHVKKIQIVPLTLKIYLLAVNVIWMDLKHADICNQTTSMKNSYQVCKITFNGLVIVDIMLMNSYQSKIYLHTNHVMI